MADADVGLTLAVAMAIGVVAQGLAQRIKIPGIVLLLAVAAFGFVMVPTAESLGIEAATLAARLGIGALIGGAAGAILLLASGPLRLLPGGLENIFALSLVILAFYLSNEAIAESGITAALAAGVVVGNSKHHRKLDELAAALEEAGEQVTLIDSNPQSIRAAQEAGLTAIHGNALRDSVLQRAKVGERLGVAALTTNDKTNYLIARLVAEDHGSHSSIALGGDERLDEAVLEDRDDSILFGGHRDLETWNALLRDGRAGRRSWLCDRSVAAGSIDDDGLPLIVFRERGDVELVDQRTEVKPGDRLVMLVAQAPPT
jgi:hypothetical protein